MEQQGKEGKRREEGGGRTFGGLLFEQEEPFLLETLEDLFFVVESGAHTVNFFVHRLVLRTRDALVLLVCVSLLRSCELFLQTFNLSLQLSDLFVEDVESRRRKRWQ